MEIRRIPDERCVSRDERGHGVRLKVNPNVGISGTLSEFLRDSTNKMELFKYRVESVMQRSHSEDITTDMYYVTTVRHVIPVEEMRTVCSQQEADADRTSHHNAPNCGFSSVLVNTSDIYVIVILIRQLSCFETIIAECKTTENYGNGKTQRVLNVR